MQSFSSFAQLNSIMNNILPPNLQGLSHESRQDRIASFHLKQLVKPMLVEKNMATKKWG